MLQQAVMSQLHNNRVIDDEEVKTLESQEYDQEISEDDEDSIEDKSKKKKKQQSLDKS